MLKEKFSFTKEDDLAVREYIRRQYSFEPSGEYGVRKIEEEIVMPWEKVLEKIPERMKLYSKVTS